MKRAVSIVEARRQLGRLAEEVRRTGKPIALTRRGRIVAQIGPEPSARAAAQGSVDAFAALRGSLRMNTGFGGLQKAVRQVGSTRAVARPGLPRISTCGITASGSSGAGIRDATIDRVHDNRVRQPEAQRNQAQVPQPRHPPAVRPPVQPAAPELHHLVAVAAQSVRIPANSKVAVVTP